MKMGTEWSGGSKRVYHRTQNGTSLLSKGPGLLKGGQLGGLPTTIASKGAKNPSSKREDRKGP